MSTTIRTATAADAPALIRLNEERDDVRSSEAEICQSLATTAFFETVLLAEVADQVVGYLCLRLLPQVCDRATYAEVNELYVAADFRRQGVAHALMTRAEVLARAAGAKEILLMTNFRNTTAQRFYLDYGFENYCLTLRKDLVADSVAEPGEATSD